MEVQESPSDGPLGSPDVPLCVPDEAVTGELSKLLNEIKMCRDKEYSFEDLCHTISSHSMESFGGGRQVEEQRNGTLTRVNKVKEVGWCYPLPLSLAVKG